MLLVRGLRRLKYSTDVGLAGQGALHGRSTEAEVREILASAVPTVNRKFWLI